LGEGWGEGKPIPQLSRISEFGIAAQLPKTIAHNSIDGIIVDCLSKSNR
jgi:hypothetical protein